MDSASHLPTSCTLIGSPSLLVPNRIDRPGKPGDVERHGRALKVGGVHGLAVDGELLDAMLVGRDRQHVA